MTSAVSTPAGTSGMLVSGRIPKLFGAMSPKDAARVLEKMDDNDVVTILGNVNDRKAAEILALLPAARAAGISATVLKNRPAAR